MGWYSSSENNNDDDLSLEKDVKMLKDYLVKAQKVFAMSGTDKDLAYVIDSLQEAISVAENKGPNASSNAEKKEQVQNASVAFQSKFAKMRQDYSEQDEAQQTTDDEKKTFRQ